MRTVSFSVGFDDETTRQMKELAELWGLPTVRHNTPVISRCVERVWQQEIGRFLTEESRVAPLDKVQ